MRTIRSILLPGWLTTGGALCGVVHCLTDHDRAKDLAELEGSHSLPAIQRYDRTLHQRYGAVQRAVFEPNRDVRPCGRPTTCCGVLFVMGMLPLV